MLIAPAPPALPPITGTIRYAQCWEDADVLLAALDVQPGDTCLAIASAGDNALALLTRAPARVAAVDYNPAQLAGLALRVAAYRCLSHAELLELIGSRPSAQRGALYARCRPVLDPEARVFWDARPQLIAEGIGAAGKFERYFRLFRKVILPLVHPKSRVQRLLQKKSLAERQQFWETVWCNRRWQGLCRLFFSRTVMSRLGRDPQCFRYVEADDVARRVLARARYAAVVLDPSENPYLQWILTGHHPTALPLALRPEHFETIRENLDRLTWRCASLTDVLRETPTATFDRFAFSDVFEYLSEAEADFLFREVARTGRPGGRLAYWTLFVERRPDSLAAAFRVLDEDAARLHARDKAFFYQSLVVGALRADDGRPTTDDR